MKLINYNENNYDLTVCNVGGFKTSTIDFVFNVPKTDDDITNILFLKELLLLSSKKYPTFRSIGTELEKLYNADYTISINKKANAFNLIISLNFINDEYTEEGNSDKVIKFLFELINNPNFNNGRLNKKIFNSIIKRMNDILLKTEENPNSVAAYNFINHLDSKSFFATKIIGDKKRINSLTNQSVADYYYNFFNRASVKIFAVGEFNPDHLNDIIKNNNQFKTNPFIKAQLAPLNISNDIPKKIIDQDNFEQSILLTCISINNADSFEPLTVGAVFNMIFGKGSLTDKLSINLREKNSLCYSIQCELYYYLQDYLISAGINKNDFNKAVQLIKQSLTEMQEGKFSDDDVKNAIKQILFSHKLINDSIYSICNSLESESIHNRLSEEVIVEKISKVTKEDIVNYANKLQIVTNYMLAEGNHAKERN